MSELSPVDAAQRAFRVVFRGFDQDEVRRHLAELGAQIQELLSERESLRARLEQVGERDPDFDVLSQEIGQILIAAKEAADGLRSRATEDVSKWRAEAQAEVNHQRRSAAEDAEAMRTDAWTTSSMMLTQAEEMRDSLLRAAEREALALTGQSERDSHRMLANARRESEEQLRLAKMEAERLLAEARAEQEAIVEAARHSAEASQERARALEVRRAEMLEELESVRTTVARLESDLEEKREALERAGPDTLGSDESTARVVPGADAGGTAEQSEWGDDTIRIIPAQRTEPTPPAELVDAAVMAEEVRLLREQGESPAQPSTPVPGEEPPIERKPDALGEAGTGPDEGLDAEAIETEGEALVVDEPPSSVTTPPEPTDEPPPAQDPDALEGLFARLRDSGVAATTQEEARKPDLPDTEAAADTPADEVLADSSPLPLPAGLEPLTLRDQLILPITNRVLRSVKRQLTEAQNIALEEVRVSEGAWEPSVGSLAADLRGDFIVLSQESFAAGYAAVETMTGSAPGRPKPKPSDIVEFSQEFAAALEGALVHHVAGVEGPRQLAAAVSRTYRVWRTDEAERRVRGYARAAYHRGVSRALATVGVARMFWMVAGRGCPDCRTMLEHGPVSSGAGFGEGEVVPPVHDECACTIIPGG